MTSMLFDGFPDPPTPEPAEELSYGRRVTLRQHADVERGIHPLRRALPTLTNGRICGGCAHRYKNPWGYLKCDLVPETHGPGTDLRDWWPGCPDWNGAP